VVFRGSYYHLLASYTDGELSRFGPGAAHMHELLRYASSVAAAYSIHHRDERYKQEWWQLEDSCCSTTSPR